MSDIGQRIQRYRLTRYASSRRLMQLRWVWIGLAAWLVWAGLLSDHSFLQIWKLDHRNKDEQAELAKTRQEITDLEREAANPKAQREQAERVLREQNGMARPGEIIYRVRGGSGGSPADSDATGSGPSEDTRR
jgi:cell division protein FtsB